MLDLPIHPADRLWVVLREEVIPKRELGLLACDYADAALPIWTAVRPDDTRMEEGIAVARRWWRGEATAAEVDSAQEAAGRAARDAWESNSAEGDAAAAVAWAVQEAAGAALLTASWAAEAAWGGEEVAWVEVRERQVEMARLVLKKIHDKREV
jgi:hypothetical protein